MNGWLIAAIVVAGAMLPCLAVAVVAKAVDALIVFELAGTLISTALMLLSEGTQRQPFIDLALVLAILSMLGAIAFARMMEGGEEQ